MLAYDLLFSFIALLRGGKYGKRIIRNDNRRIMEAIALILKEHNPDYNSWYEIEKHKLFSCLDRKDIIGSTAVK
jgi:hypothetical protein